MLLSLLFILLCNRRHIPAACLDAWREYHGQELSETPISTVEYYANDFVWWVVTENKENYFNVIGLVDCDGNLYHEYK